MCRVHKRCDGDEAIERARSKCTPAVRSRFASACWWPTLAESTIGAEFQDQTGKSRKVRRQIGMVELPAKRLYHCHRRQSAALPPQQGRSPLACDRSMSSPKRSHVFDCARPLLDLLPEAESSPGSHVSCRVDQDQLAKSGLC
jgi:hypothetical protein